MTETKIDLSKLQAMIGGSPVMFAKSQSINFGIDKEETSEYDKTFSKSFECKAEIDSHSPLIGGMLTYNDRQPVHIRVEHTPKRIPRKIKKARRMHWHGTHWQNKAEHWYFRNFYTTTAMGTMTIDADGNGTIEGSGQWTDSRHPNEMVMSREAMERLKEVIDKN